MRIVIFVVVFVCMIFSQVDGFASEKVIYSFEDGIGEWAIPDWSLEKADYVDAEATVSSDYANDGDSSMQLTFEFPKDEWRAAVVDVEGPFDWSAYKTLLCDVYLPEEAPDKIKARIALSVGEKWLWIESARATKLKPGQWVTLSANLIPGNERWLRTKMVERIGEDGKAHGYVMKTAKEPMAKEYIQEVQVLTVRLQSERVKYKGSVFVDNIRLVD